MKYSFARLGSAVLAVLLPKILPTPQPMSFEGGTVQIDSLGAGPALLSGS